MRGGVIGTAAALAAVIGLSACGSGSSASASGEETKTADQIYADAVAAFAAQPAVHVTQQVTDASGVNKVDGLIAADSARATVTDPSGNTIVLVYVNGTAYASQGGSPFQQLTGDVAIQAASLTLKQTATCQQTEHGTLTKGAISTVNGKRVIAITDDGKAPGASPGTAYIGLDGAPLPVQVTQTGPATAGGSAACGHGAQSTTTAATLTFDYPGTAPAITPPPTSASAST